jgi:hypothetical protein
MVWGHGCIHGVRARSVARGTGLKATHWSPDQLLHDTGRAILECCFVFDCNLNVLDYGSSLFYLCFDVWQRAFDMRERQIRLALAPSRAC